MTVGWTDFRALSEFLDGLPLFLWSGITVASGRSATLSGDSFFVIPMTEGVSEGEDTGGLAETDDFDGRPLFFLTPLDVGVTSPKLLTFIFHFSLDGVSANVFGVNIGP